MGDGSVRYRCEASEEEQVEAASELLGWMEAVLVDLRQAEPEERPCPTNSPAQSS